MFLQILGQLPLEHLSSCDQLRCLLGLLSLTAYITTCSQGNESRSSQATTIQNEAGHAQSGARNQNEAKTSQKASGHPNEAVLNRCLQLMMVTLESSGTASVFQLLDLQTCLHWLQRLQKFPVGCLVHMSRVTRKPVFRVSNQVFDTNRAVQPQKMAIGLKN